MKKISEVIQLLDEKYLKGRIMEESISFPLFFIDQKERLAYRFFTYYSNRYTEEPQMIHAKKIAEVSAERGHAEVFYNDEWLKYYRVEIQEDVIPEKLIPQSNDVREIMELMARVNEDSETIKTMVFQPIDAMSPMQVAFICQYYYNWMRCIADELYKAYWIYGWDFMSWMHLAAEMQGMEKEMPEPRKEAPVTPSPVLESQEHSSPASAESGEDKSVLKQQQDKNSLDKTEKNQEAETKKLASYLMFNKIISSTVWGARLLERHEACGSLAFLVDYYRELPEFKEIRQKVKELVEDGDSNELCWMLYRWIKDALQNRIRLMHPEDMAYCDMLESISRDQRALRKQGKCQMFWVARKQDYPEWFLKYNTLKNNKKK